ncbi:hypothetical protein LEP1GSC195_1375 [Leptospira wolbachii serovar Codice str. CDC]|uniref:Uncharacterized protein n=1 Tax=Leptospira wolbachii serovar Codice str. CDC TaxID=1218599 RepID=R8ZXY1_9LEPT|nr:hypothetical protein [Leptospira wolbachii]EOQ94788.1 hypothetical protein LEP1GSC195_1375 [Leptospira wolbachii serovar Codice str. CDC]
MKKHLNLLIIFGLIHCNTQSSFIYKPSNRKSSETLPYSISINTFDDKRISGNTNYQLLVLIPLIPYGTATVNQIENDVYPFIIKPSRDIQEAIAEEINSRSLLKTISLTNKFEQKKSDFKIEGEILETTRTGKMTTYMLGPFGVYLWILGAPIQYTNSQIRIKYRLLDKNNKIILEKEFSKNRSRVMGYFYNMFSHHVDSNSILNEFVFELANDVENILKPN